MVGLTRSLALEVARQGIEGLWDKLLMGASGAEKKETAKREPAKPAKVVHRFTHRRCR